MFKILGGDGKEYGPVTVEQIKQWVREGRANHETMAQPSGGIGWKPLAQYAEFADLFPGQPPAAPAPESGESAPAEPAPAPAQPAAPAGMPAMVATVAPVTGARDRAERLVRGPAIGLIVTAALGFFAMAVGLIMKLSGLAMSRPAPVMPPEMMRIYHFANGPFGVVSNLIGIAVGVFVLIGAIRMQQMRNYGIALAASILAIIPCFSPCCILGLPIGIWALVVLSQAEVREAFDKRAA